MKQEDLIMIEEVMGEWVKKEYTLSAAKAAGILNISRLCEKSTPSVAQKASILAALGAPRDVVINAMYA